MSLKKYTTQEMIKLVFQVAMALFLFLLHSHVLSVVDPVGAAGSGATIKYC